MELKSGYPYWLVKNALALFPPLQQDRVCDVLVIGAGITGALIARALCDADLDVVVLDRRDVGWGSTAASTALLQYEIDTSMSDLAQRYGERLAVAAYKACEGAIGDVEAIASGLHGVEFRRMQSLYCASRPWHGERLRDEGALRQRHGLALDILERSALKERFGISAATALLTHVAAQVDPHRLSIEIFNRLQRRGAGVFARTKVESWQPKGKEFIVRTDRDVSLRCRHIVVACGYESQHFLSQRVASNRSSYAMVTVPIEQDLGWLRDTLVWESARPYLYLRTTRDGRLLMGGEDDLIDLPARRERAVMSRSRRVLRKVRRLLPGMPLEEDFAWAGTFAETEDGLPFFGPHPEHNPRVHFAMAYGGNGIVYSVIGADMIRRRILGQSHPLARFFSFERLA
jgi:glycine/D-amino acid oxidase-like deaminating enzyme